MTTENCFTCSHWMKGEIDLKKRVTLVKNGKDAYCKVCKMRTPSSHKCKDYESAASQLFTFSFSEALIRIKEGKKLAREGWNGKGLHVEIQRPDEHSKMTLPYLYLEYPNGIRVPWLASQTDLLEEDWYELEAAV